VLAAAGNQLANAVAQGEANDRGNYNLHHRHTIACDAYTDLNWQKIENGPP
jgi:hypothetical protein